MLGASLHYLDLLHLFLVAVIILLMGIRFWYWLFFADIPFIEQLYVLTAPLFLWLAGCHDVLFATDADINHRVLAAILAVLFCVFPIRRLLVVIALLKRPSTLSQKLLLPLYPLIVYWPESLCALFTIHLLVFHDTVPTTAP